MALSTASLVGCQGRSGLVPGTGYTLVTLNPPAARAVVKLDRRSAERIASNRAQCVEDEGCI
ncbi:ribose/galactose isomerase [Ahrensia sp. R2A130]|nr:ribose/galactose isomerase [Ahrensia sp. R2A130]